ncbi:hypothetical protein MSAN_01155000 [Mycena sanguinolenta]|uniref:Uncharacterized protein n=1 Tax=Mycena sanguinolenta TaxID=230812 RepID=A0A8H6YLI2_9AGAR|nr:hypothetical protein MSAN_01155000 [Mycena sanguinolenta]
MPALQYSSSSSVLALSSPSIIAIIVFVVVVLGCFSVVGQVKKVKESRAHAGDVESSAKTLSTSYPVEKAKKAAAAAVLARARAKLPSAVSVVPAAGKSTQIFGIRRQLADLDNVDISTRFGASRSRSKPGPSPLRAVFPEPEFTTDVETPAIAHAIASALVTACRSSFGADFSFLDDEDENPFVFNLGRAVPVPASHFEIPAIVVQNPSLDFGTVAPMKPMARKRSNSFVGWKQGHTPSKGSSSKGHSGKVKEKENDGFLKVPSFKKPATSPPRTCRRA